MVELKAALGLQWNTAVMLTRAATAPSVWPLQSSKLIAASFPDSFPRQMDKGLGVKLVNEEVCMTKSVALSI